MTGGGRLRSKCLSYGIGLRMRGMWVVFIVWRMGYRWDTGRLRDVVLTGHVEQG